MSYMPEAHGMLDGLDYQAPRPFRAWKKPDMLEHIEAWLHLNPPRLELATLALEELKIRRKSGRAFKLFENAGIRPIPWLASARELVVSELPASTDRRRRGRLYVILRDGYTSANGHYGAYVGVTRLPVEERFMQHRLGIRAAHGLQDHGVELLYSLFAWANPIPGGNDVRTEYETRLHRILERAVPRVTGDVLA